MRFSLALLLPRSRRASRWSSPPAPRRARAPAASTPHTHDAASFRNFAAPARTDDRRTNDATCGPQEWLTGSLHDGGIRSVRSPLRRAPLLATPIATPLQCGRPERSGRLFNVSLFRDGRRLAHLLGQVVRLLRHGARRAGERAPCLEIIQRQLRTPRPADGRLR